MSRTLLALVACSAILVAAPAQSGGEEGLDALYRWVLQRYTRPVPEEGGTRVDYRALRSEPRWARLIGALRSRDPGDLASRDARLAFWINAYNIFAIDLVLQNYPVSSIRDVGSFIRPVWGRHAGEIGGRAYTLGEIEHEILRPLGDPRIHGAIVCASISCPDLLREPYVTSRISAQLDRSMQSWLAHSDKGFRLDEQKRIIHLSPIFDWFEEDFESQGGVLAFLTVYAPPEKRRWLSSHSRPEVTLEYMDYDWGLNE